MYSSTSTFKGIFYLIAFPLFIQAYQLKCPSFLQWKIRGNGLCKKKGIYTCLLNTNEKDYNENCGTSVYCLGAGYKFVISGRLDKRPCGPERFQPFSLPSNSSSSCVMQKSQCNGEGQLIYNNGTKSHDLSCRCNYLNNFVFVTKPKATCYCVPSQEDCSCYYKACPVDNYLTPDDQCVHFSNWTGIFKCPAIQKEKNPKRTAPTKSSFITKSVQDTSYFPHAATLTSIIISMILVFVLLVGFVIMCKKYQNLQEIVNQKVLDYRREAPAVTKYRLKESKVQSKPSLLQDSFAETINNLAMMRRHASITTDISETGKRMTVSTLVETRPVKQIIKLLHSKDYLVVVGELNSGKSAILCQLAEEMFKTEEYQIVIANKPSEILRRINEFQKLLFVFDDVCGKSTFDPTLADIWNLLSSRIRIILGQTKTKLLFSCRTHIFKEKMFQAVSILAENRCDIESPEFTMTTEDNLQIAMHYLTEEEFSMLKKANIFKTIKYIPLICNIYPVLRIVEPNVLNNFLNTKQGIENQIGLMAANPIWPDILFRFVINNNKLSEGFVNENHCTLSEVEGSNFSAHEIIKVIQSCQLFVKKTHSAYFVCYDMVFDVLVSFISKIRLNDVLKLACADILCERCHFESIGICPDYGCIKIPFDKEELYFKRIFSDIINVENGLSFKNRQLKFKLYRSKFIHFLLNKMNDSSFTESIYKTDVSPLLISTFQGFHDIVDVLLKISASDYVNMTDKVGRTALYIAAEFNDINTGKVLLSNTCDLNISRTDEYHEGESPLHIAAFKRNYDFIELLINNRVNVNLLNAMHMTALHISCTKEDEKSVKLLLENGATPDIPDKKKNIPLHAAVDKGNIIIVEALISYGSNLQTTNEDGESPLYLASSKGQSGIVKILLKARPSIVHDYDKYMSPLDVATREGFYETVKLLLDSGAYPDGCFLLGKSPLYIASEMGHIEIAKYLLEKKANPNICTYDGSTPLYVSSLNGYTEVVDILLQKNADPNKCSSEKLSPLYVACLKGDSKTVKMLLNKNADVSLSDLNNITPLYVASRDGQFDIVKLLLDKRADLNQATVVNRTPICVAALEGHLEIVRYLLHKNADINIATVDHETPLIVSTREGHTDIVNILNSYE